MGDDSSTHLNRSSNDGNGIGILTESHEILLNSLEARHMNERRKKIKLIFNSN